MTKRNLATIDTDIGQDWSRLIKEAFADGLDCDLITEGGKTTTGIDQGLKTVSLAKNFEIGTRRAHDGKVYRYAKCDTGTPIVAGDLIQSAANGGAVTAEQDCTIATASTAGASFGYATMKSTGATAKNQYEDGYYIVSDGSAAQGCGQMKKIASHPATTGAVTCKFTFEDTLEVLISTSAKAGIVKNLYDDVIQAPITTPSGVTAGVAPVAVPVATPYFWLQTWGLCPVLAKAALSAGKQIVRDVDAAGSVGVNTYSTSLGISLATEVIGQSGWATSTGDNGFVYLMIAP